ncbi:hypothetical protein AnigIFM63326_001529 [Aspergillus niger]|nr:hypothetical protein AnigIFM63326_001529 [Aspergillus niger]
MHTLQQKSSPEAQLKRLAQIPTELEALYLEIYEEMKNDLHPDDMDRVVKTLSLLIYQEVPLKSNEIVEAIFEPDLNERMGERTATILDLCSHLVEYDSESTEFRLAHLTVKVFLDSQSEYHKEQEHARIAKMCLPQVEDFLKRSYWDSRTSWKLGHFICYALTQRPYHVWKAGNERVADTALYRMLNCSKAPSREQASMDQWLRDVWRKIDPERFEQYFAGSKSVQFVDETQLSSIDIAMFGLAGRTTSNPPNPLFVYPV